MASRTGFVVAINLALALALAGSAQAYIYWGDFNNNAIGRANNDGSGVNPRFINTGAGPVAVAVDGSNIFWANENSGSIGRANLDGSGVNNGFITGINQPDGVAVSPTHVYWTSLGTNSVGRANLDGSAPSYSLVSGIFLAAGLAVDSGHVYWVDSNASPSYIGRAGLDGSAPDHMFVTIPGTSFPFGMTVTATSIYWTDSGFFGGGTRIGRAHTSDGLGADPSFIGDASTPTGVAVLGSQLYWANSGTNTIARANTDATGVNQAFIATGGNATAGVAIDSLVPSGAFTLGKVKQNKKRGTATLPVTVSAAGSISLTGKGAQLSARASAASKEVSGAGTVTLKIKATGKAKKQLSDRGKTTLKLTITFSPTGGAATTQAATVKLIKR